MTAGTAHDTTIQTCASLARHMKSFIMRAFRTGINAHVLTLCLMAMRCTFQYAGSHMPGQVVQFCKLLVVHFLQYGMHSPIRTYIRMW